VQGQAFPQLPKYTSWNSNLYKSRIVFEKNGHDLKEMASPEQKFAKSGWNEQESAESNQKHMKSPRIFQKRLRKG